MASRRDDDDEIASLELKALAEPDSEIGAEYRWRGPEKFRAYWRAVQASRIQMMQVNWRAFEGEGPKPAILVARDQRLAAETHAEMERTMREERRQATVRLAAFIVFFLVILFAAGYFIANG
mgnify:CR=1 FL=1